MRKYIGSFLCSISAVFIFSTFPCVGFADSTGIVDIKKVMAESRLGKELQKKVMDRQKEVLELFKKEAAELKEMKKRLVSAERISEKEAELQAMWTEIREKLQEFREQAEEEARNKLEDILLDIQREKRFSTVLNKGVVLSGGIDITEEVIQRLSKQ